MNRTYKVIWSKARHCYVVVSELTKSQHKSSSKSELISTNVHQKRYFGKAAGAAIVAGLLTFGGVAYSPVLAADKDIVDKGAQPIAYDISPANDGTNIAIGKNAKVFIGGGTQESMLSFGETVHEGFFSMHIHDNNHAKQNLPEAIAVGTNSYARTGAIEIGAHTLAENQIAIGDTTADKLRQFGVASTTLGTNSYTGGGFATTIGSYNVQTNQYEAKNFWDTLDNATKNAFSTVIGTFNSNESMTGSSSSGVANMISGMANKVTNSNGAIVMGAGNSVKESSSYIDASPYSTHFDSVADMQKALMDGVASSAGGATLVIGGANSAEKTQNSQIMGVGNSMKSTTDEKVQYNYLDGFNSSITDASHLKVLGQSVTINKGADSNTVIGDYRTVAEGQTHNVIIGNADEKTPITTEKKDTVILGHNANATIDGGVAIGSDSIANVEKGQKGYYVKHDQRSEEGQGYPFKNNDSAWISRAGAVSVGDTTNEDQSKWITRQITGVAAGTKDTDAVNVAQLKAISNIVDASKTKYYSVNDSAPGAIFDNEEFEKHYTNKNNDGAKSYYAMAAGYGTYAAGDASTVIGSYSVIQNDKVKDGDDEDLFPQGATAVSVGSFNFNLNTPIKSSNDFSKWYSGTANSIVGQGNLTKDSNGVLIYGAGNKITNSYRGDVPINMLAASMNSDVYQNPESFTDKVGEAVLQSGGQVMAIGGGNVADKAYMTQLMGVGNKVQGADITFTPPELQDDEENYERYITAFNSAFNKQATRLNYVDGFYNNLTNAKNDYVIGMANDISGDDVSSNKSNIVIGDFHQMKNGSNNIILGSQDGKLTQKRYNTDGTLGTKESVNRFTHQEKLADAVMIGHNADVLKNGGVALGADSVASVDKDVVGYDPSGIDHSEDTTGVWKSKAAAVSVGDASKNITRQITNLAAGAQDTDAVNVAQLKAAQTHFYSVNSTDEKAGNYNNDGAKGKNSLAAGVGALANGSNSVAIGTNATIQKDGNNSVAIGTNAKAQNDALAVGESASAGNNSIAIGMNASAGYSQNMALGYYANVAKGVTNSTALGYGSQVTKRDILKSDGNDGVISVGKSVGQSGEKGMTRRIINVKAGVNDTDAVNVSQLKQQAQAATTEVMAGTNIASVTKNDKTSDGHTIYTVNAKGTTMSGDNNFTITATPNDATNVTDYKISLKNTIIIGSGAESSGAETHPITINGTDGVISGLINTTWDKNHDYSQSTKAATEAQLQNAMKDAQKAAEANDTDTHVKAGEYAVDTKHQVSMDIVDKEGKSTGNKITITDVAKASDVGDVKKLDADIQNADGKTTVVDAVNKVNGKVGDLNYSSTKYVTKGDSVTTSIGKLDEAIKSASEAAGKHTIVSTKDANLSVDNIAKVGEAANYQISMNKDLNVDSVTAANKIKTKDLEVTDSATIGKVTINKDNKGTIGGLTNKTWDAKNITSGQAATEDQLQAATKNAVNYDGDDSKTVTLREDTTIQNVANTTIEEGSKNAVNAGTVYNETRVAKDGNFVKQSNTAGENLAALDNQVTANTESIYHMNGRISDLDNRVNKVGAGAAALAALHPLDFDPDDKWDFAVGYGNYRNANSVALGAFYRPNEDTMFSLGTNFGNGENMFNAGLSFKIGQGGSGITTSKTAMAKKIESLENTVDQQDKKIAELEALVKEQGEMIRQYVGKK